MIKKKICFALSLLFAFSLTACTSPSTQNQSTSSLDNSSSTQNASPNCAFEYTAYGVDVGTIENAVVMAQRRRPDAVVRRFTRPRFSPGVGYDFPVHHVLRTIDGQPRRKRKAGCDNIILVAYATNRRIRIPAGKKRSRGILRGTFGATQRPASCGESGCRSNGNYDRMHD